MVCEKKTGRLQGIDHITIKAKEKIAELPPGKSSGNVSKTWFLNAHQIFKININIVR